MAGLFYLLENAYNRLEAIKGCFEIKEFKLRRIITMSTRNWTKEEREATLPHHSSPASLSRWDWSVHSRSSPC